MSAVVVAGVTAFGRLRKCVSSEFGSLYRLVYMGWVYGYLVYLFFDSGRRSENAHSAAVVGFELESAAGCAQDRLIERSLSEGEREGRPSGLAGLMFVPIASKASPMRLQLTEQTMRML
jgi:hypothetical protein